jgi:hypothetical protein
MRRERRDDHLDSRITQTARDLYKLGRKMLRDGVDPKSREWGDVGFALNKALGLGPWCELVLDLEGFSFDPKELEQERWRVPLALHRQPAR